MILPHHDRGGPLADDDGLDAVLGGKGAGGGRNRKREAKDKKYGFGGKKRQKGQSDPRSINDMSTFNPRQGGSGRSRNVSYSLTHGSYLSGFATNVSFLPANVSRGARAGQEIWVLKGSRKELL